MIQDFNIHSFRFMDFMVQIDFERLYVKIGNDYKNKLIPVKSIMFQFEEEPYEASNIIIFVVLHSLNFKEYDGFKIDNHHNNFFIEDIKKFLLESNLITSNLLDLTIDNSLHSKECITINSLQSTKYGINLIFNKNIQWKEIFRNVNMLYYKKVFNLL